MNESSVAVQVVTPGVDTREAIALEALIYEGELNGPLGQFVLQQHFRNTTRSPLEIVYTFPLSSKWIVTGFQIRVNGQVVKSVVKPLKQVEKEYDEAVLRGDTAVYLQQHRSNVFTINVGNLAPGEECVIQIRLLQLLELQGKSLRLLLPTVVGPRFIPGTPTGSGSGFGWAQPTDEVPDADWITPPVAENGVPYRVTFRIAIPEQMPIQSVDSPSHPLSFRQEAGGWVIQSANNPSANRDIVLNIQFQEQFQPRLWLAQEEDTCFGLAWISPEKALQPRSIPTDYLFLLDISGSMAHKKLEVLKRTVLLCLRKLSPEDRINLIAFESAYHPWRKHWEPMNEKSLAEAERWIQALEATGGTMLLPALEFALAMPSEDNRRKVLVLLTDGEVGNEAAIAQLFRQHADRWTPLLFGIDTAVNQELFEEMLRHTEGAVEYIYPGEPMESKVNLQFERLGFPAITEIQVLSPRLKLQNALPPMPLLLHRDALSPVILQFKGALVSESITLNLIFRNGEEIHRELPVVQVTDSRARAIVKAWAHAQIQEYESRLTSASFQESKRNIQRLEKKIEELGVQYQLQSKRTAWLAVLEREEKIETLPKIQVVPVELPETWIREMIFPAEFDLADASREVVFEPALGVSGLRAEPIPMRRIRKALHDPQAFLNDLLLKQNWHGAIVPDQISHLPEWYATLLALLVVALYASDEGLPLAAYRTNLEKALRFLARYEKDFQNVHWILLSLLYEKLKESGLVLTWPSSLEEKVLGRTTPEKESVASQLMGVDVAGLLNAGKQKKLFKRIETIARKLERTGK